MHAFNGILFKHESSRRGKTFVTRKITRGLANIAQGLEQCLHMGNLRALRDWGHAKDYVRMHWMMLQQDKTDGFVIDTDVQFGVRQFIKWSAEELGVTLKFAGEGDNETPTDDAILGYKAPGLKAGNVIFKIDPRHFPPTEVETFLGDPSKAKLGWSPEITVQQMYAKMVAADLEEAKKHAILKKHSYTPSVSIE